LHKKNYDNCFNLTQAFSQYWLLASRDKENKDEECLRFAFSGKKIKKIEPENNIDPEMKIINPDILKVTGNDKLVNQIPDKV